MNHVDDRPLPALVKKEAAKTAGRSSRPQSSSKAPKLMISSKAPADPPRVSERKHRRRSVSRLRNRHKAPSSFEDFTISSKISGSSGRLTTPAAFDTRSRSQSRSRFRSRSRENRHRSHRKSAHRSRRPSPGLTSPTPSHGSRRHRDSHSRRETPPLPVPAPKLKLTAHAN
jgi:arginine/serine-rich splicing factor 2